MDILVRLTDGLIFAVVIHSFALRGCFTPIRHSFLRRHPRRMFYYNSIGKIKAIIDTSPEAELSVFPILGCANNSWDTQGLRDCDNDETSLRELPIREIRRNVFLHREKLFTVAQSPFVEPRLWLFGRWSCFHDVVLVVDLHPQMLIPRIFDSSKLPHEFWRYILGEV